MGLFFNKPQFVVNGRTVLITGGSQGMGRALARLFAQKGADVIIVARDVKKLQAALEYIKAAAIRPQNQRFHYISADVTKPEENERIIAEATAWNNGTPPGIVWANAGHAHPTLFLDTPIETLRSQMDINYWAATYLAHATLKAWLQPLHNGSRQKRESAHPPSSKPPARHFIITSSTVAFVGVAGYSPYSPAKSALRSLSDTLRSELNLYNGAAAGAHSSSALPEVKNHIVLPGSILSPGLADENKLKHPVTVMLEDGDPAQTEDEVAKAAIRGLEKGHYLITTQFLGHAMRASALQGSPRNGLVGIRDTLFSWATSVAWLFIGPDMERKVWNWGRQNGVAARNKA